jgi:DNA adenine methylase
MTKPILKYRGGKSKEIPEIIKHIPDYSGRYMEPFFGGGSLYFYLEPSSAIINDINDSLMAFYLGLQNDFDVIKKELKQIQKTYETNRKKFEDLKKKHPNDRVEDLNEALYYQIRDMFNGEIKPLYHRATIYYFINKTAYSGMIRYNSQGKFNVPYGRYRNFNTDLITKEHSDLLKKTEIMTGDYMKVFSIATDDDFIFLDPPYDCIFSDYGNKETKDGFGEEMHRKLANDFYKLKAKALMVIGKTDLTMELYGNNVIAEYEKSYSVNIRNRFKSEANHILVANYKPRKNKV